MADAIGGLLSDIWNGAVGLAQGIWNNIVVPLWDNIVYPIIKEVMAILGFEGQTIVNGFCVSNPIVGTQEKFSPFKKAIINSHVNDTLMLDEIKNIFITGDHINASRMVKYEEANSLLPSVVFSNTPIKVAAAKAIIELQIGEPIIIRSSAINQETVQEYCINYLKLNSATTGYVYDEPNNLLYNGIVDYSLEVNPFNLNLGTNTYDISVSSKPSLSYEVTSITNNVVATSGITVTPLVPGTASVVIAPTYTPVTLSTLLGLIPFSTSGSKRYDITYSTNALPNTNIKWYHTLVIPDTAEYAGLYSPSVGATTPTTDTTTWVMPIIPVLRQGSWVIDDLANPNLVHYKKMAKLYGDDFTKLTDAFKSNAQMNIGADAIKDIFYYFGVNIALVNDDASLSYVFEIFNDYAPIAVPDDSKTYQDIQDTLTAVDNLIIGYERTGRAEEDNYYLSSPGTIITTAFIDSLNGFIDTTDMIPVDYGQYYTYWLGYQIESYTLQLLYDNLVSITDKLKQRLASMTTKITIQSNGYNASINYRAVGITTKTGVVTTVGSYKKITSPIGAPDYTLTIQKQTSSNTYDELIVSGLTGFTAVSIDASTVYMAPWDFVGDDNAGKTVKNNFTIPLTWGKVKNLPIVKRKELLFRSFSTLILGGKKTELDFYETAAFWGFVGSVLTLFTLYNIFTSFTKLGFTEGAKSIGMKYLAKSLLDKIIQKIILANPNSPLAQALSVLIGVIGSAYIISGDGFNFDNIGIFETINAVADTGSIVGRVYTDMAIEDAEVIRKESEASADYWDTIEKENFPEHSETVAYIKQALKDKAELPEDFFNRINLNTTDILIDTDFLLQTNIVTEL